jgi:tetratricopeptide (TPR) repeat protein/predicted Ser/Thr protein kinase
VPSSDEETIDASWRESAAVDPNTSSRRAPVSEIAERGSLIGRYVVLSRLGAGAMGVVLAAYDPELDRKVALKLLKVRGGDRTAARQRLQREAQALAKLNHPNVVGVHDVGVHGDQLFVAMEFVEGETLGEWMAPGRAWHVVVGVFEAAGRGLSAAHAQGLVHRDFKPDNVMIGADARVRVMDLGLARAAGEASPTEFSALVDEKLSALETPLTKTGAVMGTPAYMAPEQFSGLEATEKSDQFAYCVALFEALRGARPFHGDSLAALAMAVSDGDISEPPHARPIPRWLQSLVRRGLASDPSMRFEDMNALLEEMSAGESRGRRRRAFGVVGVIGVLVAGAVGWDRIDEQRSVLACDAEGGAIREVWNDETRRAVEESLRATGSAHAEVTARKLAPWLDQQADAWAQARTEACLEAGVRDHWTQDTLERSVWCMEERRLEMAALVAELRDAKPETVNAGVMAVSGLRAVDPCLDEQLLARFPEVPDTQRADVEAVRAELSRVTALRATGDYEAGLALAQESLARAEELAWTPLIANARRQVGHLLSSTSEFAKSESALEQAYFEAASAGANEDAIEAATAMSYLVGTELQRPDDAYRWWRHAEVLRASVPDPEGVRLALSLSELASVRRAMGDFDEALRLREESLPLFEEALGRDHPEVATALNNLGDLLYSMREYDRSLEFHERALEIYELALGPDHPDVSLSLNNLAAACYAMGEYEKARAFFERSLAIREVTFGPDHPELGPVLSNLGEVHRRLKDFDGALRFHRRALTINEEAMGPDHIQVAASLNNLAMTHREIRDTEKAKELFARALPIWEAMLPSNHPNLATALNNLALSYQDGGEYADARALFERALAVWEESFGPDHVRVARAVASLAAIYALQGEYARAKPMFLRAVSIFESADNPNPRDVARVLEGFARAARAAGEHDDALALAERALAMREGDVRDLDFLAKARFLVAQLLTGPGEASDRARDLAEQSRGTFQEHKHLHIELGEVEAWISAH